MMIHITEQEREMNRKADRWRYLGEDGYIHLKEDAPLEIKKHEEKMKKKYEALSFD